LNANCSFANLNLFGQNKLCSIISKTATWTNTKTPKIRKSKNKELILTSYPI